MLGVSVFVGVRQAVNETRRGSDPPVTAGTGSLPPQVVLFQRPRVIGPARVAAQRRVKHLAQETTGTPPAMAVLPHCCLTAEEFSAHAWDMAENEPHHGFVTIQSRGVVALPRELRKRMHMDEPGAQLELTEREDGVIEMRPQIAVPLSQSWFWTKEWQQREREADDDIAADRVSRFEDAQALLDALPD